MHFGELLVRQGVPIKKNLSLLILILLIPVLMTVFNLNDTQSSSEIHESERKLFQNRNPKSFPFWQNAWTGPEGVKWTYRLPVTVSNGTDIDYEDYQTSAFVEKSKVSQGQVRVVKSNTSGLI